MSHIYGSYGRYSFSLLKILHSVFQSSCTSSHFFQKWVRSPLSSQSRQHLVSDFKLILSTVLDMTKKSKLFYFAFFSLLRMIRPFQDFISNFYLFSWELSVYIPDPVFKWWFGFWTLNFQNSLYILSINPGLIYNRQRFSPILWVSSLSNWLFL